MVQERRQQEVSQHTKKLQPAARMLNVTAASRLLRLAAYATDLLFKIWKKNASAWTYIKAYCCVAAIETESDAAMGDSYPARFYIARFTVSAAAMWSRIVQKDENTFLFLMKVMQQMRAQCKRKDEIH